MSKRIDWFLHKQIRKCWVFEFRKRSNCNFRGLPPLLLCVVTCADYSLNDILSKSKLFKLNTLTWDLRDDKSYIIKCVKFPLSSHQHLQLSSSLSLYTERILKLDLAPYLASSSHSFSTQKVDVIEYLVSTVIYSGYKVLNNVNFHSLWSLNTKLAWQWHTFLTPPQPHNWNFLFQSWLLIRLAGVGSGHWK